MKEIKCIKKLALVSGGTNNLAELTESQAINCSQAAKDYGTFGFFVGFSVTAAGAYMLGFRVNLVLSVVGFVGGVAGAAYLTNYCYSYAAVCDPDSGFYVD